VNTTVNQNDNPDEPRPAGETERDNDALRPTDPKQRQDSGESTAQETAKPHTRGPQTHLKP
jgi:hypothetical protein